MNSYKLQSQWQVVRTRYHETTKQLTRKVGFEGTPTLGPYWKSQPVTYKGKRGVEIRIESVNKDNLSIVGQNFSWPDHIGHSLDRQGVRWPRAGDTLFTKTEVFACASRSKAKAKPRRPSTTRSSSRTIPILERTWIDVEPGAQFDQAFPVATRIKHSSSTRRTTSRRRWSDRILGDWKMIFGTNLRTLSIGLMKCGRARWQEAEATIRYNNNVLTRQDKKFFTSELFKVIQDAIPWILTLQENVCDSEQFLRIHLIILDVRSICTPSQF